MKLLAVLVVAGPGFWFIGARIVDRGSDVNAVAPSTNDIRLGMTECTLPSWGIPL